MSGRTHFRTVITRAVLPVLLVAGPALAQLPPDALLQGAEEHTTAVLPAPNPHRVYVVDMVFPHLVASKVYIVDGDKREIVGMINSGYVPNLVLAPDHREIYVAETYWSRGTRGVRVDVVTFYDPRTLVPSHEVVLPNGRFLVVTKKYDAGVTPDGRYLLSFNMAPSTTVSVVDLKGRRYVGEVETPGCALVFPAAPTRFASVCTDGALLVASFDATGKASARRSRPFFDPKKDPVFEHPGVDRARAHVYFVTYDGMVHPVDLAAPDPVFAAPWSLLAGGDAEWRPGGWQIAAFHRGQRRLFVLMHKGPRWTHKQAAEEVWAFDVDGKKRVARIPLEHHAISVAVSQDAKAQLYTLSETATLAVHDVASGQHLGTLEGVGEFPYIIHVDGE